MEMSDFFVHGANVLYLLSYLVRDILWLRALTIIAIGVLCPYYFTHDLWAPIAWNLLFLLINVAQIVRLLLDRRPVRLTAEQERLYHLAFRSLTPRELLSLLEVAERVRYEDGDTILTAGQELDALRVIAEGEVSITLDGEEVATLREGQFVGEMSYLTRDPTSASASALGETTCLSWPKGALDAFLESNPAIKGALQMAFNAELAGKLRHQTEMATSASVDFRSR